MPLKEIALVTAQKEQAEQRVSQLEAKQIQLMNELKHAVVRWVKSKGISWEAVSGPSRTKNLTQYRVAICCFLVKWLKVPEVGAFLKKDRTTMYYYHDKEKSLREKTLIKELENYILKHDTRSKA